MRSILIIGFIIAMFYMISVVFDKYTVAVEEQDKSFSQQK